MLFWYSNVLQLCSPSHKHTNILWSIPYSAHHLAMLMSLFETFSLMQYSHTPLERTRTHETPLERTTFSQGQMQKFSRARQWQHRDTEQRRCVCVCVCGSTRCVRCRHVSDSRRTLQDLPPSPRDSLLSPETQIAFELWVAGVRKSQTNNLYI